MAPDFRHSAHTVVLSDIHLADAEPPHPHNPLWKRFKRPEYFVDETFHRFIEYLQTTVPEPIELILNGDIFDFDSVMRQPPKDRAKGDLKTSWLERLRGLNSEEEKSRFKIQVILEDHAVWAKALRDFLARGKSDVAS